MSDNNMKRENDENPPRPCLYSEMLVAKPKIPYFILNRLPIINCDSKFDEWLKNNRSSRYAIKPSETDEEVLARRHLNLNLNLATVDATPAALASIIRRINTESQADINNNSFLRNLPEASSSRQNLVNNWVEVLDPNEPVFDFERRIYNMAITFPFELDPFQKLSILKIEERAHVLVAAHTSAGKTVVAEYAIAKAFRNQTRVIYASPVKALSNQKFREFSEKFEDVGLITGDTIIKPFAKCLIVTTEILRLMLFNGANEIRNLEFIIIDEVHYVDNVERGYVWEEVLILLPPHCQIVMLSATVPNAVQFASWLGRIKRRKVSVISTTRRPVNLYHCLYTGWDKSPRNSEYLILGPDKKLLEKGYNLARKSFINNEIPNGWNLPYQKERKIWIRFVYHLRRKQRLPAVSFILSRNRCCQIGSFVKYINLTTPAEKAEIKNFLDYCLGKLDQSNRKVKQVMQLEELLLNGIGIHHSGILPILKEIVEILFQRGLVKLLLATETFSVGLNMPCRTVILESLSKCDNNGYRLLLASEYVQMAGRAGRRGMDESGNVIILCHKELPTYDQLVKVMTGNLPDLNSKYRITYSTILNFFRRQITISIEAMMENSYKDEGLSLYPEYQKKLRVLKYLGFIDNQHHLTLKGEIASKLNNHELILAEILYRNMLKDLTPSEVAALLSCLVFEDKTNKSLKIPRYNDKLKDAINETESIYNKIMRSENLFQVGFGDEVSSMPRLNFSLCLAVNEWAKGESFNYIVYIAKVQAGTVLYGIRKLNEIVLSVQNVAKTIGDSNLFWKMDEVSRAIMRDIVSTTSLYTQNEITF